MDVKTLCLGILTSGDATGYEIKRQFETHFSHFYEASFGSIYPALARLTADGQVTCVQHVQEKRPDKKVYSITSAGRLAFLDELMQLPKHDRVRSEFLAIMLFGDLLPPAQIDRVIDAKLASYRHAIEGMKACDPRGLTAGHAFVHGFGLAVYKAAAEYLEENRHTVVAAALLSDRTSLSPADASPAPESQLERSP